jgi:hypothetical protein
MRHCKPTPTYYKTIKEINTDLLLYGGPYVPAAF